MPGMNGDEATKKIRVLE